MGLVIPTGRGIGQSGVWDVYCTVLCCKIYGWMGWGCLYCRLMTTMIMRMMMLMIMLIMVL